MSNYRTRRIKRGKQCAVKRGGRFDTQIYIPLPDEDARKKLISLYMGKDPGEKDRLDIPCASVEIKEETADSATESTDRKPKRTTQGALYGNHNDRYYR